MAMFFAGIDEAGYGPLLGPLCVGCAAFTCQAWEMSELESRAASTDASRDDAADSEAHCGSAAVPCLWTALRAAVCRAAADKRKRIAVNDSKKLKGTTTGTAHPLRHLERGVTAFASAAVGGAPSFSTDDELLSAIGAPVEQDRFAGGALPLPVGNRADQLRIAAATLRTALQRAGITATALRVRAISPREFNKQSDLVGNKATINWMAAMHHVDAVRRSAAAAGCGAFVALDQHGGRRTYVRPLAISFPDARIRVLHETDECARYRLECPAGDGLPAHSWIASFEQGGETRHLPVALASMAAKFVRELHMRRLNAFFARHVPELKETAGYVEDGRRFLQDVNPVVRDLGIAEAELIRSR